MRTAPSSREWSRRVKCEGRARCGRPDAAVAERPSGRDVRGLSGGSATARRGACSSGGRDGAAQRGSGAAARVLECSARRGEAAA